MTTTSSFQKYPDFFETKEESEKAEKNRTNTNPRYKLFCQTHFTAGDEEQFQTYRDPTNGALVLPKKPPVYTVWQKYHDIDTQTIDNTFRYLFHKFKKAIFIKIKNGDLKVFLPFSKNNYTNEWSHKIHVKPDLNTFLKGITTNEGYTFSPKKVNRFIDTWYTNDALVRCEFPIYEGDTNISAMSDMFRCLSKEREIPDIEFFLNKRDFPLLKKDGTEPYENIYDGAIPLLSHNYPKYAPILSMVTNKDFADIAIPTGDDWARVSSDKFFPFVRNSHIVPVEWRKRRPVAVFRGASTGCGVTQDTNPRLKIALLSQKHKDILDAGITEWNLRPRKIKGEKYLQTIDISQFPPLVKPLSQQEQAGYKYVVNIEGHVAAFRLGHELEAGMCVLLVESKYKLWYSHLLEPNVHYVPVKHDLSDLIEKIEWCKSNDSACKKIAENAREFALKYLSRDGILDYLRDVLVSLKHATGVYFYNEITLGDIRRERELKLLAQDYPVTNKKFKGILPRVRGYEFLHGVELITRKILKDHPECLVPKNKIFSNRNTEITVYDLGGYKMIEKTGEKDVVHEVFVMTQTNLLAKEIPNFAFMFGYKDKSIFMEYIEGETLFQYIQSSRFSIDEYVFILFQIALATYVAQKNCSLVHYDLAPWNIILRRLEAPTTVPYIINGKMVYRVTTSVIPVIIDMARSHVIKDDFHYGIIDMFSFSTIQDIVSILSTSVYQIAEYELSRDDEKKLITVCNFITNTNYKQEPFRSLKEVRWFFGKTKKYSELLTSNKHELEERTAQDFADYLLNHFSLGVKKESSLNIEKSGATALEIFSNAFEDEVEFDEESDLCLSVTKPAQSIACDYFDENTFQDPYALKTLLAKVKPVESSVSKSVYLKAEKLKLSGVKVSKYYDVDFFDIGVADAKTFRYMAKKFLKQNYENLRSKEMDEKAFEKLQKYSI